MWKRKRQKERSYEALLLGEEIRQARVLARLTQVKLARKVGVTPGWMGRVERGIHLPNIPLLVHIARALGLKVKDLLPF